MKKLSFTIILAIILKLASSQPMNGTYIIGGPIGQFSDLSLAAQALQQNGMNGPVTFKIYPGTYYGAVFIGNVTGNSYTNKITIESLTGNNDDVILTRDNQVYSNSYIILVGDIENIEIRNLKFVPTGLHSNSIKINNSYKIMIKNCIFYTCGCPSSQPSPSVGVTSKDSVIIIDNRFNGCWSIAAFGKHIFIEKNNFFQNSSHSVNWGGDYCQFNNNTVFSNLSAGIFGNNVISNDNTVKSLKAENNIIILKGKFSVFWIMYNDSTNYFRNNIIVADSGGGISGWNSSFVNNTIITSAYTITDVDHVKEMKNNIFIATKGPLFSANSALGLVNSDYNLLYSPSSASFCTFFDTNVVSIPDFTSWKQTGADQHSQWGIPLFSKPYDLHLQAGNTLALGAGIPMSSVLKDIDGDIRDALYPDIGADEVVIRPVLDSAYYTCMGSPYTLDAGAGFSTYQWSTGAITQSITLPSSTGSAIYSCTVTYGSNSGSKTTKVNWVNCTGLKSISGSKLQISFYPNPANANITIAAKGEGELPEGVLQIFGIQGNMAKEVVIPKNQQSLWVDLSGLQNGLYLGRIVSKKGEGVGFKFVKE